MDGRLFAGSAGDAAPGTELEGLGEDEVPRALVADAMDSEPFLG
jgi:hypothetical protein